MNDLADREAVLVQIRRAGEGDAVAQRALVRELTPIIRASVLRALRRRSSARRAIDQEVDDMTQSALFAVFVKDGGRVLLRWDPDRGYDLAGYIALIAAREVDGILRSRRRNPWLEVPVQAGALDDSPGAVIEPESLAGSRRMVLAVAARLEEQLSARAFALFERLFLQDREPEEVAAAEGLDLQAIYTWRSRLARAARAIAADLDGDPSPRRRVAPLSRSSARRRGAPAPRAPAP